MTDTNYFSGIVKLLENPQQLSSSSNIIVRAELPQKFKNQILLLQTWGNLGFKIKSYYKANDYILIEGYVHSNNKKKRKSQRKKFRQITITVLKIYPILLNSDKRKSFV